MPKVIIQNGLRIVHVAGPGSMLTICGAKAKKGEVVGHKASNRDDVEVNCPDCKRLVRHIKLYIADEEKKEERTKPFKVKWIDGSRLELRFTTAKDTATYMWSRNYKRVKIYKKGQLVNRLPACKDIPDVIRALELF